MRRAARRPARVSRRIHAPAALPDERRAGEQRAVLAHLAAGDLVDGGMGAAGDERAGAATDVDAFDAGAGEDELAQERAADAAARLGDDRAGADAVQRRQAAAGGVEEGDPAGVP